MIDEIDCYFCFLGTTLMVALQMIHALATNNSSYGRLFMRMLEYVRYSQEQSCRYRDLSRQSLDFMEYLKTV